MNEWHGEGMLLLLLCSLSDVNRLPSWERGHLLAGVASSTDASTLSSEGGSRAISGPRGPHYPYNLGKLTPGGRQEGGKCWS